MVVSFTQMDVKDYERAEKLLPLNRSKLVPGATVNPVWIDKGPSFWYCNDTAEGHAFVVVDPAKRSRVPAFDHLKLAAALSAASGEPVDAAALPFKVIELVDDVVEFDAFAAHWRCDRTAYTCQKVEGHTGPNPMEVRSPDGKWGVSRRDNDIWVRSLAKGEERALTSDGVPDFSYASPPDCFSFEALMRSFGAQHLPPLVSWSPDSRRVVTHRLDQRNVRLSHLIESSPPDGGPPVLHSYRYAFPGDDIVPTSELIIFDPETGDAVTANTAPILTTITSPFMSGFFWWSPDSSAAYLIEQPRDLKALWLKRLDPATGEVQTLIEERGGPHLDAKQYLNAKPIVHVLSGGEEVLWYSQRNGWGHLYLYDTNTGALRGQVTSGDWAVQQILHVDEKRRVVYFLASGLVKSDIYRRQVCRVGLDGTDFARLGDDDLDHIVTVSPEGDYYVDSASSIDTPPVIRVCGWNGDAAVELERADISRLVETGWTAPERFCVKAADGVTDIYGVLYRPHGLDQNVRYPVIDSPYPGPNMNRVQASFGDRIYDVESLAALGFVVVAVDGRGTPGRDKAFLDMTYGRQGKAGFLEDHLAAIRELAKSRPWMDIDRVGIFGMSGGGFATVRAMCTYPEFYKVGVSMCGNHDQRLYQVSWGETHIGAPGDNADPGHTQVAGPVAYRDKQEYVNASNVEIADRLQGKLLLVHGEMDDNVHPHLTMRVVDRLIAANKDFDLLIVPGAEHLAVFFNGYMIRRRWDFLVRHLKGVEPPSGYRIETPAPSLEALFG